MFAEAFQKNVSWNGSRPCSKYMAERIAGSDRWKSRRPNAAGEGHASKHLPASFLPAVDCCVFLTWTGNSVVSRKELC